MVNTDDINIRRSVDDDEACDSDFFEDSTKEDEDKSLEQELPMWDTFKHFPPKRNAGSMTQSKFYEIAMRGVKLFVYMVLFVLILAGGVATKSTLLFAISNVHNGSRQFCIGELDVHFNETSEILNSIPPEEQIMWLWCIVLCFAIPEAIGFLDALTICIFKTYKFPGIKNLCFVLAVELLSTVGLSVCFLIVLPSFDILNGASLTSCVCLLPAVLATFCRSRQIKVRRYFVLADIASLAVQLLGMTFYCFYQDDDADFPLWILPILLAMISLRWWPNYVSLDSNRAFIRDLARLRESMRPNRHCIQAFTAILRVSVFALIAIWAAHRKGIEPPAWFDALARGKYNITLERNIISPVDSKPTVKLEYIPFEVDTTIFWTVLGIHVVASMVVYACGRFAVRTLMQKCGYALPLNLITPTTICFLSVVCLIRENNACYFEASIPNHIFFNLTRGTIGELLTKWSTWLWFLWPLSQFWITIHTWSPEQERLAATDKIFCIPMYDSLLIEQSMLLNRRRDRSNDKGFFYEDDETVSQSKTDIESMSNSYENDRTTKIYACATMWHETDSEMNELMGSILRLDMDQCAMRLFKQDYKICVRDYYELEIHIFFDDAFCCMHECPGKCRHKEDETHVNSYVMTFIETVEKNVARLHMQSTPPVKYPTPYGGRLTWILPGKTKMFVHLKDKNKIRHRKRWSQVMYMYYLLGFRLMELPIEKERREILAENTYILTLDGDIDFRPSAVKTLVDLMKRDKDLGAACGRIHPIGRGPIVWYQKFEYAVGHWLQKSTEHIIGCVLCCPGCFSLFRAKALMENNVLRKYATRATEARHYVQYDQGEDRWLCTLILQMGYKVEYSAASDAYTHAPETFNEFFIQRRRWIPSTVANILDLLETAKETRKLNPDITGLYIIYQWFLMGSTIIGPGTIFLMLVGAFVATFPIDQWSSFAYNLIPVLTFVGACFLCKERTQLTIAAVITTVYGLVMIVVLVGITIQIAEDGWLAPSTLLFFFIATQLVIAGLLHPQEWSCLLCGIIYYITVPSMYMILIIFSLFNVNNVTWGTREKKVIENIEETEESKGNANAKSLTPVELKKKQKGSIEFSLASVFKCMLCTHESTDENIQLNQIKDSLNRIDLRLSEIERNRFVTVGPKHNSEEHSISVNMKETIIENLDVKSLNDDLDDDLSSVVSTETELSKAHTTSSICDNFLVSPCWLQDARLQDGEIDFLTTDEEIFWKQLIKKYLLPLDTNKQEQEKIAEDLCSLRNEFLFKFFMINALFVLSIFLMQLNRDMLHLEWPFGRSYNVTYDSTRFEVQIMKDYIPLEPIGCLFIIGFVVILGIQFLAMLLHRFNTFAHLLTKVSLECICCNPTAEISNEATFEKHAHTIAQNLQRVIDGDVTILRNNKQSMVPPSRRKTVHELVDSGRKEPTTHKSLMSLFRKNLDNLEYSNAGPLLTDKNSKDIVEMFHKRRTTVINQRLTGIQKNSSVRDDGGSDSFLHSTKNERYRKPTDKEQFIYVNDAFEPDDFTTKPPNHNPV